MERSDVELNKQERDALAADDRRIAELLGSLARVEAPENFEFGVRAKIAAGAASPQSPLVPFLKFAAPLTLLILVGVFVVFYNTNSGDPDVAGVPSAPVQANVEPGISGPQANPRDTEYVIEEEPVVSAPPATRQAEPASVRTGWNTNRNVGRGGSVDAPLGGGSKDITISPANTKLPRGFESLENGGNSNSDDVRISLREVFGILGIVADYANGSWLVKSSADGSLSMKSGVKAGDILDSIDGQRLEKDTSFKTPFSGKTIRVRREGKNLEFDLRN